MSMADRFRKTSKALIFEQLRKNGTKMFPFLQHLSEGQIFIPQTLLESQANKKITDIPEITSLKLECQDGYWEVTVQCKKALAKYAVQFKVSVEAFFIGKERQVARFSVSDNLSVQGVNWVGRISEALASSLIDGAMHSEKTTTTVREQTKGLVDVDWPKVIVHLDTHPAIQKVNSLRVKDLGIWDLAEITGCAIKSGGVVLQIGLSKSPT